MDTRAEAAPRPKDKLVAFRDIGVHGCFSRCLCIVDEARGVKHGRVGVSCRVLMNSPILGQIWDMVHTIQAGGARGDTYQTLVTIVAALGIR